MTNFEHYKEDILQIVHNHLCGITLKNNTLQPCERTCCSDCQFNCFNEDSDCKIKIFEWLYNEYKPIPKLTKQEHAFCIAVETGYIARNPDGELNWYKSKPYKKDLQWVYGSILFYHTRLKWDTLPFKFIQWEDNEPWSVKDLLKLQVKE